MKKVKVFKIINTIILLLIISSSATLAKETKQKENLTESKQRKNNDENSNIPNLQEMEIEINAKEYAVENFKIKKIIKRSIYDKNENPQFYIVYEHIKSGAKVVVYFENYTNGNYSRHISKFNDGNLYFRYIPTNNKGIPHIFSGIIGKEFEEEIDKKNLNYKKYDMLAFNQPAEPKDFENSGLGFQINIHQWDIRVVDIIAKILKNPKYLSNDYKNIFEIEKKRMDLKLREEEQNKSLLHNTLSERFIGGKFRSKGKIEEIQNLNLENVKKEYEKNVIPENMMLQLSSTYNPDYKEIMKRFDEKYLSYYKKKNIFKEKNIEDIIDTTPVRKTVLEEKPTFNNKKTSDLRKDIKQLNNKAVLYWDLKNLTPKEKEIFHLNTYLIYNLLQDEIKKLGYEGILVNNYRDLKYNFEPIQFDSLFYLDFYGNDASKFTKDILKENAKKILNILYEKISEKIKKADYKNGYDIEMLRKILYNLHGISPSLEVGFNNYENQDLYKLLNKSFSLVDDPFSEKYFNIDTKNNILKDDCNNIDIIKNLKQHESKFKLLIEKDPDYIDIFKTKNTNNKNKPEEEQRQHYDNPIIFSSKNKKNFHDNLLKDWAEKLTSNEILDPNLKNKGIIYDSFYFPSIVCLNTQAKKIGQYLFDKFIKDFKNFKPTMEQFKKIKSDEIKGYEYEKKGLEIQISELKNVLKDPEKIKKFALMEQKRLNKSYNLYAFMLDESINNLNNNKNTKKEKKRIKELEEETKKLKDKKDDLKYITDEYKIKTQSNIHHCQKEIEYLERKKAAIDSIKFEELVNIFKNAKIQNIKIKDNPKLTKINSRLNVQK